MSRVVARIALVALCLVLPAAAQAKLVFRDLVLHGASKSRPELVLARMRLHPGDPVDFAVLQGARQSLLASGLYTSVEVDTGLPRAEATQRMYLDEAATPVDVQVTLTEKQSWFLFPNASLGSGDRAAGLVYVDQNLRGRGTRLLAAAQYGESKTFVVAGYRDPLLAAAPLTYGFSGVYRLEDFRFYDNRTLVLEVPTRVIGGEAYLGWVATPTVRAQVGAIYNRARVDSPSSAEAGHELPRYNPAGGNIVVSQLSLLYDATTAPEGLQQGSRFSLKNELSDELWGSDFDYVKLDFHLELFGHWWRTYPSLALRTMLNYPTSDRGVPLTQLLRAGGSDLRGFITNEFHGDTLVELQLEDQLPIWRALRLPWTQTRLNVAAALFVDTGALLDRHPGGHAGQPTGAAQLRFRDFHSGLGAGLRLLLPGVAIPALKLDGAYGLDAGAFAFTLSIAGGTIPP